MRSSLRSILLTLAVVMGAAAAPAHAADSRAFVLTTDFSTGSLSDVDLDDRAVNRDVAGNICPDVSMRWFDGRLYVVNRFGCDNVLVLDPGNGYSVVQQFSTGNGSNPHDIALLSPTRAYVTRYDRAEIMIVNPISGAPLGEISLARFADADGIPEMDRMVRIGNRVFVSVQRLDRNQGFTPTDSSLIVVIDAVADTFIDADPTVPGPQGILLQGENPVTTFAFDRASGRLLIGCVGRFGQLDGGIEWIDPVSLSSEGFAITEAALGGDIGDLAWNGAARSYAIVSDASFNAHLVAWNANDGTLLHDVFSPGGFSLPDCEVNDRGELYVCDNDFFGPGLFVYSTSTDLRIAGPLDMGLPPYQVTFDQVTDAVASVPAPARRLGFSIGPNPARGPISFSIGLPHAGKARLEVFDVNGRRLRAWELEAGATESIEVRWDLRDARGTTVAPGIVLARVEIDDIFVVRRMVVVY